MKNIIIVGCGGFGKEVLWLIQRINNQTPLWKIIGYVDDAVEKGTKINNIPVLGNIDILTKINEETAIALAVGSTYIRKKIVEKISINSKLYFPNLIDPSIIYSKKIVFGKGNIICAGNIFTVNINIGDFNIINLACTIGHDVVFQSFITIFPGVNISGCVLIKNESEIGTGSSIIQGITIFEKTVIGAGAVVISDLPSKCTAVGIPAKPVRYRT